MSKDNNNMHIQLKYLEMLSDNATQISVYLINGIKLSGWISEYDDSCILLRDNKSTMNQLIYKHAISTIVPAKANSTDAT